MCVTIELDYKEALARRKTFDEDIKFCVNESLQECWIQLLPHYKVRFMTVRRNKWEKIGENPATDCQGREGGGVLCLVKVWLIDFSCIPLNGS